MKIEKPADNRAFAGFGAAEKSVDIIGLFI